MAALEENGYYMENCRTIMENREWTITQLEKRGFTVLPSLTNFVFAKTEQIDGEALYQKLKNQGILVRHFRKEAIRDHNRITIGTMVQMRALMDAIDRIMQEETS